MTGDRLYFSHSYHLDDLRFNEHVWRLLMGAGFHAWIDTGREPPSPPGPGRVGVRRPMDISFNEWMMSQCDGFVAIVPSKRQSQYQLLEYRLAVRMGIPCLVAVQEGGNFKADDSELIELPTSWKQYWSAFKQKAISEKVAKFREVVTRHTEAAQVLRSTGYWMPHQTVGKLTIALLPPRSDQPEWPEWLTLQKLLKKNDDVEWRLLPPANYSTAQELMQELRNKRIDVLAIDVGPRGTPPESLGYIHAVGPPQLRLCRVNSDKEKDDLGRYLKLNPEVEARSLFERDVQETVSPAFLPRFLDGTRLDDKMQPVIFWAKPEQAAEQIQGTARRIDLFRAGLERNPIILYRAHNHRI